MRVCVSMQNLEICRLYELENVSSNIMKVCLQAPFFVFMVKRSKVSGDVLPMAFELACHCFPGTNFEVVRFL